MQRFTIITGHPSKVRTIVCIPMLVLLLLSCLLSACGGPSATQLQAEKEKTTLDQQLSHARTLGVPIALLQPITNREQDFRRTSAPSGLFSDQAAVSYYTQLSKNYSSLSVQLQSLTKQAAVVNTKFQRYNDAIVTMQLYGMDTTAVQKKLDARKSELSDIKTQIDYQKFPSLIDADIAAMHDTIIKGEAQYYVRQFHQEVKNWGDANQYHDAYDGQNYSQDFEYDQQGIGSDLDADLSVARTDSDFQGVTDRVNNSMAELKAMEADYKDTTPYNQPHQADRQLMQYYNVSSQKVVVVSLIEQTLRVYQNGQLVKAFYVTTGQTQKPSLPGLWHVDDRQSPTTFKSYEPPNSPFWYPDTHINFAMGYYAGEGYYLHDSWWRVNYGPHTNYPHYDVGGDETFAGNGTHGCINMTTDLASWLYDNTPMGTPVIVY